VTVGPHLARRFERDVGTTPMRWVAVGRIDAAASA
jgi:AraC-like DNA-binding protein